METMRDLPVVLDGYKLTVVEPPAPKTRQDANGAEVPVTDREGVIPFVVSLFAKLQVQAGQRAPKGEEIKVTLTADPGEGFPEDARVQLIDPKINPYSIESPDGRTVSGIAFKAMGLRPAHPAPAPMRRGKDDGGDQ
ncbi:hypothetical protein Ae168Ps1_3311c [Pseudonocardia sp. Ae168_Ps1]|nr:hypothetical protein Ae150APs1_3292c [Pseudonocardia sp. Ae150A_Ps1]OLL80905.1 hypothetical protein Ae168Ps1_3311c [Pseudonocardia sp. Ae168_Ps1]OLL84976.1 hypothetical protein Ae263Ps1_2031 [Pseudonocardia sp. Ae263_Ps1]OLL95007.1 hypothetical protein Ae356Ps1_4904c [Pseudonocardia sp. Ae356_Ps1]